MTDNAGNDPADSFTWTIKYPEPAAAPAPDEPAPDEPAPDEPAPDEPAPDEPAPAAPAPAAPAPDLEELLSNLLKDRSFRDHTLLLIGMNL